MLIKILELVASERPSIMTTLCYITLIGFPRAGIARAALGYVEESSETGELALELLLEYALDKVRSTVRHISGGESN